MTLREFTHIFQHLHSDLITIKVVFCILATVQQPHTVSCANKRLGSENLHLTSIQNDSANLLPLSAVQFIYLFFYVVGHYHQFERLLSVRHRKFVYMQQLHPRTQREKTKNLHYSQNQLFFPLHYKQQQLLTKTQLRDKMRVISLSIVDKILI